MTIMVTLEFPLLPNMANEISSLLQVALADTRKYKGCQKVEVFVREDQSCLLLVEYWQSKELQESYLQWRIETGLVGMVEPFMSGPLEIKYFDFLPNC